MAPGVVLTAAIALLGGCLTEPSYPLNKVVLDGPSSVAVGSTVQLTVSFYAAGGRPIQGYHIDSWSSSNPSVAAVSGEPMNLNKPLPEPMNGLRFP